MGTTAQDAQELSSSWIGGRRDGRRGRANLLSKHPGLRDSLESPEVSCLVQTPVPSPVWHQRRLSTEVVEKERTKGGRSTWNHPLLSLSLFPFSPHQRRV